MQKLTILILITLILSPLLSAEEESIILDRDILYWKPAGPDLIIPDTYFSPELLQYPEGAFRSSLFFPLSRDTQVVLQEKETEISDQELLVNWTPPSLFTVEEKRRDHSFTAYGSYPYGSGVLLEGQGGLFCYEAGANYAHGEGHPHWISATAGVNSSLHNLDTRLAWRFKETPSLLSLFQWNLSSSPSDRIELSGGAEFQSLILLNPSDSVPDIGSVGGSDHQWKASTVFGGDIKLLSMNAGTSITAEYRESLTESYWRFTPELEINKNYKGLKGDWSLEAGVLVDLYSTERTVQYFPQLHIDYINYSSWSFYLDSESIELDDSQVHSFLVEEVYNSPETAFYRYHNLETGFYITKESFQINMGGGFITGNFPEIEENILKSNRKSLFFIDSSVSWKYKAGKVTELNCYADYQDWGSLRFFFENRWFWRKTEERPAFGILLRAGNRELLRGYKYFFDDSSDLMTGAGFEIEFIKPLQTAVYMDYLPLNKSIEGRIELSWAY